MTNRQEMKLSMYKAVKKHQDDNSPVVSTIPELESSAVELGGIILSIEGKDTQKGSARAGKAQDKYDAKKELIEHTMIIAGGLYALGKKTKSNELIETGNFARTDLKRLRDSELIPVVTNISDKANFNAAALVPFGITADMIARLITLIAQYNSALSSKESATGVVTGATVSLANLYNRADELLLVMDRIMEGTKKDHYEFFVSYFANRVIRDLGRKRTKLGSVAARATQNIFSTGITDSTQFILKNTGTTQLKFFSSSTGLPTNEPGIIVAPKQQITATTLELGSAGSIFLNVTNLSSSKGGRWKARRVSE